MTRFRGSLVRLAIFLVVVILGTTFTVRALQRPAAGEQERYTALFTNASGLRSGDDVRLLGVQVGKVESVELRRGDGGRGAIADVTLTLDRAQTMYRNTKLAIRFQNLTGQRYLDVQQAAAPGTTVARGATIGTDQTVPSFDITSVFNGLQPVLATMRPEDIDHFAQSIATVVDGDGSGLGPLLEAIDTLSTFTDNRAALFEQLIRNFSDLSETVGGKSGSLTTVVGYLRRLSGIMADAAPAYRVLSDQGARVITAADALLANLGLTPGTNPWLDDLLSPEAKKLGPLVDLAALLPGLFAQLTGQRIPEPKGDSRCSKGVLALPAEVQMLIKGTRVTLCNDPN